MLSSMRYWDHNGSKWSHFSPAFLRDTTFDRAENFFTDTRHYLGWVFFFGFLISFVFKKKSQNTRDTLKKACFFTITNFVTAAKNHQSNIFWNKKKYPPEIVSGICEKNFSSISLTMPDKWGRGNSTFFAEKFILRKTQQNEKILLFSHRKRNIFSFF